MRFTKTDVCDPDQVDETVRRIVQDNRRDRIAAANDGQIGLINVSLVPYGTHGKIVVCCLLGD